MDFTITQYEFGQRPPVSLPSPLFLELLSESGIRKMVSDHYDLLSKSEIKHLFPRIDEALDKAKQRSSDFLFRFAADIHTSTKTGVNLCWQSVTQRLQLMPKHVSFG